MNLYAIAAIYRFEMARTFRTLVQSIISPVISTGNHIKNFGQGAVYFGWLGALVGLIAITGNRFMVWGDVEKMGPALAVAMLTILYGYIIKLVTIALTED